MQMDGGSELDMKLKRLILFIYIYIYIYTSTWRLQWFVHCRKRADMSRTSGTMQVVRLIVLAIFLLAGSISQGNM